jgi:hypothetical protein
MRQRLVKISDSLYFTTDRLMTRGQANPVPIDFDFGIFTTSLGKIKVKRCVYVANGQIIDVFNKIRDFSI